MLVTAGIFHFTFNNDQNNNSYLKNINNLENNNSTFNNISNTNNNLEKDTHISNNYSLNGTIINTEPLIMVNDPDIRVNETFTIWIDEKDLSYSNLITWDFNDGSIKVGGKVDHKFSFSNVFTVIVKSQNKTLIAKIELKIKNEDEVNTYSGEGYYDIRYSTAKGGRLGLIIKEGITQPTFIFNISIKDASGKVGISIDVFDYGNKKKCIYTDIQEVFIKDVFYLNIIIIPEDYQIINNPYAVMGGPIIEEGRCSSFEIIVFSYY